MSLQKVALITGGSKGIGASIALKLAKDGFNVAINYKSNTTLAEEVLKQLRTYDVKATAIQCDVANTQSVEAMFTEVEKVLGKVDVLVNNAGIMQLAKLSDSDDKLFDSQIAVNFKGTFNTLRQAALRLNSGGRIVNLSTSVVALKLETYGIYAATKAAVETLTAILSKELRGRSITVSAVAPGPTTTDLFLSGKSPELIKTLSQMNPLERLGSPKDIANAVSFLVGPDGAWINGQILRSNGGMI
jgi:3-oxoacyl-[acyl-carrier protein] reductase